MHAGTLPFVTQQQRSHRRVRYLMFVVMAISFVLAGCASRTSHAPITDMTQAPATDGQTQRAGSGSYVVKAGDTLYSIAQGNNVDVGRLAQLNDIQDPSQLRVGQVLRLDGSLPKSDTGTAQATPIAPVAPVTPVGSTAKARADDANVINWAWPTNGKIIQGFNFSTKGIDLEGTPGDPILAAADGKVMYTGNGIAGLGNLILLGHSDGFITAYAHNQDLLVKTGQEVKKGDKIATLGSSDSETPRLHFEVRRRGTPVDPLSYLPSR